MSKGQITALGLEVVIAIMFWTSDVRAFDGYGVCLNLDFLSEPIKDTSLGLLRAAGAGWIRTDFRWHEIESDQGHFKFERYDRWVSLAATHHLQILGFINGVPSWASGKKEPVYPPMDLRDYTNFVHTVVQHYPQIRVWEIWNEPDIAKFWKGTEAEYIVLLKTAYEAIKDVDPSLKVMSAGLDGKGERYFETLLESGAQQYFDIAAFHPYAGTPEKALERVKAFKEIMKKHGVDKPLWITEIGWQTGGWPQGPGIVKDEATQAEYLEKVFPMLRPYAEMIFWFRGVETPRMYGLLEETRDGVRITPAYEAFKRLTGASSNRTGTTDETH